jgi:hypothetical protein
MISLSNSLLFVYAGIGFVRQIDSKKLSATIEKNGAEIKFKATVVVGLYVGLKWGAVKIGSQTVNSTDIFDTSYIPE